MRQANAHFAYGYEYQVCEPSVSMSLCVCCVCCMCMWVCPCDVCGCFCYQSVLEPHLELLGIGIDSLHHRDDLIPRVALFLFYSDCFVHSGSVSASGHYSAHRSLLDDHHGCSAYSLWCRSRWACRNWCVFVCVSVCVSLSVCVRVCMSCVLFPCSPRRFDAFTHVFLFC